jgi:hypothetical protein
MKVALPLRPKALSLPAPTETCMPPVSAVPVKPSLWAVPIIASISVKVVV